jgi:hypothetical protein
VVELEVSGWKKMPLEALGVEAGEEGAATGVKEVVEVVEVVEVIDVISS